MDSMEDQYAEFSACRQIVKICKISIKTHHHENFDKYSNTF